MTEPFKLKSNQRSRKRDTLWFNAPYSLNVKADLVHKFLNLIDKCFKNSKLRKIFNRNFIIFDNRTTQNLGEIISSHNSKLLRQDGGKVIDPDCKCRNKSECPLDGKCNFKNIVYQATITPEKDG